MVQEAGSLSQLDQHSQSFQSFQLVSLLEVAIYLENLTATQALKMSVIFAQGHALKSEMFHTKSTNI